MKIAATLLLIVFGLMHMPAVAVNTTGSPQMVEIKSWIGLPSGNAVSILNRGADCATVFPDGTDRNFGVLEVHDVDLSTPIGAYEAGCRLLDCVAGVELFVDVEPFEIL